MKNTWQGCSRSSWLSPRAVARWIYGAGEPCKRGERADRTKCRPKSGAGMQRASARGEAWATEALSKRDKDVRAKRSASARAAHEQKGEASIDRMQSQGAFDTSRDRSRDTAVANLPINKRGGPSLDKEIANAKREVESRFRKPNAEHARRRENAAAVRSLSEVEQEYAKRTARDSFRNANGRQLIASEAKFSEIRRGHESGESPLSSRDLGTLVIIEKELSAAKARLAKAKARADAALERAEKAASA